MDSPSSPANDSTDPEPREPAEERATFAVHYTLPGYDGFVRAQPAVLEGPDSRWNAARQVIDFGCWLLEVGPPFGRDRALRDAVLVALLRRALITAESIRVLLANGLEEPAIAATRTLLDIELALKLVTSDSTNRMAERLAAWHYYSSQKHGQRMLSRRETRTSLAEHGDGPQRTVEIAQSYAAFLERPVFDAVREEVKSSQMWHGYKNVEAAFDAAGAVVDYHVLYDIGTFFVHDTNVDHDYADVRPRPDGGQEFVLKPLVQRDPEKLRPSIGSMVIRLHQIFVMYVEDRGLSAFLDRIVEEQTRGTPASHEPGSHHLTTMEGLMTLVLEHFGDLGSADDFRVESVNETSVRARGSG